MMERGGISLLFRKNDRKEDVGLPGPKRVYPSETHAFRERGIRVAWKSVVVFLFMAGTNRSGLMSSLYCC